MTLKWRQIMIRNLFILDESGHSLVSTYFGECHSFGDDDKLVTGFISALHSIGQTLGGRGVDEIRLGALNFVILSERNLLFAIAVQDDSSETAKEKLSQIADLFLESYGSIIFDIKEGDDHSMFQGFPAALIEMGIAQTNCGKYPDCSECPESAKEFPVGQYIERLQKG